MKKKLWHVCYFFHLKNLAYFHCSVLVPGGLQRVQGDHGLPLPGDPRGGVPLPRRRQEQGRQDPRRRLRTRQCRLHRKF